MIIADLYRPIKGEFKLFFEEKENEEIYKSFFVEPWGQIKVPLDFNKFDKSKVTLFEILPESHKNFIRNIKSKDGVLITSGEYIGKYYLMDEKQADLIIARYISFVLGVPAPKKSQQLKNYYRKGGYTLERIEELTSKLSQFQKKDYISTESPGNIIPDGKVAGYLTAVTADNIDKDLNNEGVSEKDEHSPYVKIDFNTLTDEIKDLSNPYNIQKAQRLSRWRLTEYMFAVALGARFAVGNQFNRLNDEFSKIFLNLVELGGKTPSGGESSTRSLEDRHITLESNNNKKIPGKSNRISSVQYKLIVYRKSTDEKYEKEVKVKISYPDTQTKYLYALMSSGPEEFNKAHSVREVVAKSLYIVRNSNYIDAIFEELTADGVKIKKVNVVAESDGVQGTKADVRVITVDRDGNEDSHKFGFSIKAGSTNIHYSDKKMSILSTLAGFFHDNNQRFKISGNSFNISESTIAEWAKSIGNDFNNIINDYIKSYNTMSLDQKMDQTNKIFENIANWYNSSQNKRDIFSGILHAINISSTLGKDNMFFVDYDYAESDPFNLLNNDKMSEDYSNKIMYRLVDLSHDQSKNPKFKSQILDNIEINRTKLEFSSTDSTSKLTFMYGDSKLFAIEGSRESEKNEITSRVKIEKSFFDVFENELSLDKGTYGKWKEEVTKENNLDQYRLLDRVERVNQPSADNNIKHSIPSDSPSIEQLKAKESITSEEHYKHYLEIITNNSFHDIRKNDNEFWNLLSFRNKIVQRFTNEVGTEPTASTKGNKSQFYVWRLSNEISSTNANSGKYRNHSFVLEPQPNEKDKFERQNITTNTINLINGEYSENYKKFDVNNKDHLAVLAGIIEEYKNEGKAFKEGRDVKNINNDINKLAENELIRILKQADKIISDNNHMQLYVDHVKRRKK